MVKRVNAKFDTNVPYYIPCNFPFIHENLKLIGYKSRMSLLLAAGMNGIPYFVRQISTNSIKLNFFEPEYLGYKPLAEYIGIVCDEVEFENFSVGIEHIGQILDKNRMPIVFGTPYHLPYSDNYHKSDFSETYGKELGLYDHAIGVCELDRDSVTVYDTTPIFCCKKVDIDDFRKFWHGNKYIRGFEKLSERVPLFEYGCMTVNAKEKKNKKEVNLLIERGLRTVASEYLLGRQFVHGDLLCSYGYQSLNLFIDDIKDFYNSQYIKERMRMVFEMRFTRYFMRDILEDMSKNAENTAFFLKYHKEFIEIVSRVEAIGNFAIALAERQTADRARIDAICVELKKIQHMEQRFYDNYLKDGAKLELLERIH